MCEVKVCNVCGCKFPIEFFISVYSGREIGACSRCQETKRKYRLKNRDKLLILGKEYRNKHKEELSQKQKLRYNNNKREHLARMQRYYQANKERLLLYAQEYRKTNKDRIKEYLKATKQERYKTHNEWCKRNQDKIKQWREYYSFQRTNNLPSYYIRQILKGQGFNPEDITPDLIEIKQAIIQINRKVKQSKTE